MQAVQATAVELAVVAIGIHAIANTGKLARLVTVSCFAQLIVVQVRLLVRIQARQKAVAA
jgi:hypothetical protein